MRLIVVAFSGFLELTEVKRARYSPLHLDVGGQIGASVDVGRLSFVQMSRPCWNHSVDILGLHGPTVDVCLFGS